EPADPVLGGVDGVRRYVGPPGCVAAHTAPERDQAEPVPPAQGAEQLDERSLRLVELVAGHRAGHVEHGYDITPPARPRLRVPPGAMGKTRARSRPWPASSIEAGSRRRRTICS